MKSVIPALLSSSVRLALFIMAMIAAGTPEVRAATPDALEPAWFDVSLNGQRLAEPVYVLMGPGGSVYVSSDRLRDWRFRVGGLPTIEFGGTFYIPLSAVSGVTVRVEAETQTLVIQVVPDRLEETRISFQARDPGPMTRSGRGAFLNYEVVLEHSAGRQSASAALELGAFLPEGSGTATFLGRWSGGDLRLTRLETNWVIDDPNRMRTLRFGDGITRGGIGGRPLRFGGIQFARSFDVQPGFVTLPMPGLSGSAALPSVVDIYVNNVLQGRHELRPGPFSVVDLPVVTGSGEIQLVVRDLLGRETMVRESYYAAPQLLRAGLHDYSFEGGFLRKGFGRRSNDYGSLFLSGTYRLGLTDWLTGEAHAEATRDIQVAGASAAFLVPEIGLFTVGAAGSHSERGTGAIVRAGFERRTPKLSYGAIAELLTENFVAVGSVPERERPTTSIQAFAGAPLPFGSIGVSYTRRAGRGEADVEIISANASIRLGALGTLNVAGRRILGARDETAIEIFLSIPLGPRTHVSGGVRSRGGSLSVTGAFQRSLPAGEGSGYNLSANLGNYDRIAGRFDLQTDFGSYGAQMAWSDGNVGVRVAAAGSVGAIDGRLFASRRLTQSFAAVAVGDFPNVRVYADNQLAGRTGADGIAIIPSLRAFERNPIRIELADLPMDAEVTAQERSIRPYRRSGVSVDFEVSRSRSAIINVRLADGTPLPAGASVRLATGQEQFVSAPGGDVYLTGLQQRNTIFAEYPGSSCSFELMLPETAVLQPRLGPFTCERARR